MLPGTSLIPSSFFQLQIDIQVVVGPGRSRYSFRVHKAGGKWSSLGASRLTLSTSDSDPLLLSPLVPSGSLRHLQRLLRLRMGSEFPAFIHVGRRLEVKTAEDVGLDHLGLVDGSSVKAVL